MSTEPDFTDTASPSLAPSAPDGLPAPDAQTAAEAGIDIDIAMIAHLASMAMDLAVQAHERASEAHANRYTSSASERGADPVLAFSRAAHSVTRLISVKTALQQTRPGERSQADAARDVARRIRCRSHQQRTEVVALIERSMPDIPPRRAYKIGLDIAEHMAELDLDAELEHQTLGNLVLTICQDLGIVPDLTSWTNDELGLTPEMMARDRAEHAAAGPRINWIEQKTPSGGTIWVPDPKKPMNDPSAPKRPDD